jgi:hypothetical protein
MSKIVTPSQVEKILKKCQKRLRLSDWDIDIKLVAQADFVLGRIADCNFSESDMEAHIRLLDPRHNHYEGISAQNIEAAIYHELLHILITPNISKDCPNVNEEQLIERIAKALVGI